MKPILLIAALLGAASLATASASAQTAPSRTEVIHFAAGTSSKTVKGSVKGYDVVDYIVAARAGQTLSVTLRSSLPSNSFDITLKGEDTALYNSSINGNAYSGVLPKDGDYVVHVYLMRNDARRNKVATYTLTAKVAR